MLKDLEELDVDCGDTAEAFSGAQLVLKLSPIENGQGSAGHDAILGYPAMRRVYIDIDANTHALCTAIPEVHLI